MTSKISFNNLFQAKFKQHLWVPSLLMVGMFFTILLPVWMSSADADMILYNPFIQLNAISFSFITPFIMFRYLLKKSEVDFFHSLPIKRNTLFLVNFFTGLCKVFIPFSIFYFIACITSHDWRSSFTPHYITIIMNSFVIYTLSTLAIMIAGNIIMSVILSIIFNGLLFGTYFSIYYLIN